MKILQMRTRISAFALALILTLSTSGIRLVSAAPHRTLTDDFVITVKTDNLSAGSSTSTQFTIPTYSGETYNYNVDCDNDGTDEASAQTETIPVIMGQQAPTPSASRTTAVREQVSPVYTSTMVVIKTNYSLLSNGGRANGPR